jgi:5-methylcytosine-specific restriction enzyme subunit McrC
MQRFLTLTEYQTRQAVPLSLAERDQLRTLVPSLGIAPTTGHVDCYDLTPGSQVGGVRLPDLAVEIRPKIPIERLLFLISYTLHRRQWRESDFDLAQHARLVEAIVPGFVAQTRRALRRGVLQGYRVEEDALPTVRGRLRFEDQLRRRHGVFPPAEVRYDEFTEDIEENRLLKAAIARLGRLRLRSERTRQALRVFDDALANVRLVEYDARRLPAITWTRLNERYQPAVALARLILRAISWDLSHGPHAATAFLVDMNQVFEDFVILALREELRLSERAFPQGALGRGLRLDLAGRVTLQPDISWWAGARCLFVGDVKYKRVNVAGIKHADLYQLLAYTVAADLPGGLLIYAAGEGEPAVHRVRHAGKALEVVTLDLSGDPDAVLRQIAGVAERVRELRNRALLARTVAA